jgi:hypothetical protein
MVPLMKMDDWSIPWLLESQSFACNECSGQLVFSQYCIMSPLYAADVPEAANSATAARENFMTQRPARDKKVELRKIT